MANTLKFGNGEWYGKKDTILAYNDENSNYKPLPFDFSRASKATVINKDGLIETVGSGQPRIDFLGNTQGALKLEPQRTNVITYSSDFPNTYWTKSGATIQGDPSTAGSELIVNGDFATDSDWTKGTGWSISGGKANSVDTLGFQLSQPITYTSGKIYKVTYTISNYVSGSIRAYYGGTGVGAERNANGTYTDYIAASGSQTFYIRSTTTFIGSIDNVSVKEVQGFTSPDGTTNAYKLVEGTNNGNHSISATVLVNSGDNSFSMYVKENGRKHISLYTNSRGSEDDQYGFYLNGSGSVTFNNTNGDATITSLSNGWYRVSITHPSSGYNTRLFKLYLSNSEVSSNTIPSYQGDGLKGVYIYGAQLEVGSYPTSYIPTQGSTVTRLKDTCTQTPPDGVIGQTEGVLYCEVDVKSGYDTNNLIVTLSDGTNLKQIYINRSNGKLEFFVGTNVNELLYVSPSILTNGVHKLALAYKQNDFAVAIDGVIAHTDNSGNVPTCNKINVGSHYNGSLPFNDRINDIKLYNTRLSDSELQALTS